MKSNSFENNTIWLCKVRLGFHGKLQNDLIVTILYAFNTAGSPH